MTRKEDLPTLGKEQKGRRMVAKIGDAAPEARAD